MLFSDTDSFCYSIKGVEDVYATIRNSDWFDFSNFPKDHLNYNESNKMVPGKFKDESPANEILEFAGLRSKMYSIKPKHGPKKAAAKGVSNKIRKRKLKHEDFRECIMTGNEMFHDDVKIEHKNHQLETKKFIKKTLSPFYDKTFRLSKIVSFSSQSK